MLAVLVTAATAAGAQAQSACMSGPVKAQSAARVNATFVNTLVWLPFRRPEIGWATYAPLIAREIGTSCGPHTPGFAAALGRWQAGAGRGGSGVFGPDDWAIMKPRWHQRRPFVALRRTGCPPPPGPAGLAAARGSEGYMGKAIQLQPGALAAYRRMVADARARLGPAAAPPMLTIFSGFRDPAADAARCAAQGNCDGMRRAVCSPHRTGTALDIVVGNAPGHPVDSTADVNRRAMSRTPAYRWLVANAHRYGFAPYAFEPWHWEWTGRAG